MTISPDNWDMLRKLANYYNQTKKVDAFLENACKGYNLTVAEVLEEAKNIHSQSS